MSLKFARDRAQFARDRADRSRPLEIAQDRSGSLGIAAGIPVAPALLRRTPCRALTVPTTPASQVWVTSAGCAVNLIPMFVIKNGRTRMGRSCSDGAPKMNESEAVTRGVWCRHERTSPLP